MKIDEISKMGLPMSGYEVAGYLYGNSNNTHLASLAYSKMRKARWVYDEFGEEVWSPPKKEGE
jgi:hypothetical protein